MSSFSTQKNNDMNHIILPVPISSQISNSSDSQSISSIRTSNTVISLSPSNSITLSFPSQLKSTHKSIKLRSKTVAKKNKKRKINEFDLNNNKSAINPKKRRLNSNSELSDINTIFYKIEQKKTELKELREYKMKSQIKYKNLQIKYKQSLKLIQKQSKYIQNIQKYLSFNTDNNDNNNNKKQKKKKKKKKSKKKTKTNRKQLKRQRGALKMKLKEFISISDRNDAFLTKNEINELIKNASAKNTYLNRKYNYLIVRLLESNPDLKDINQLFIVNVIRKCVHNGTMEVITNDGLIECKYDKYIILISVIFEVFDLIIVDDNDYITILLTKMIGVKYRDYFRIRQLGMNAKLTNNYEIVNNRKDGDNYIKYKYIYNGITVIFASNHTTIINAIGDINNIDVDEFEYKFKDHDNNDQTTIIDAICDINNQPQIEYDQNISADDHTNQLMSVDANINVSKDNQRMIAHKRAIVDAPAAHVNKDTNQLIAQQNKQAVDVIMNDDNNNIDSDDISLYKFDIGNNVLCWIVNKYNGGALYKANIVKRSRSNNDIPTYFVHYKHNNIDICEWIKQDKIILKKRNIQRINKKNDDNNYKPSSDDIKDDIDICRTPDYVHNDIESKRNNQTTSNDIDVNDKEPQPNNDKEEADFDIDDNTNPMELDQTDCNKSNSVSVIIEENKVNNDNQKEKQDNIDNNHSNGININNNIHSSRQNEIEDILNDIQMTNNDKNKNKNKNAATLPLPSLALLDNLTITKPRSFLRHIDNDQTVESDHEESDDENDEYCNIKTKPSITTATLANCMNFYVNCPFKDCIDIPAYTNFTAFTAHIKSHIIDDNGKSQWKCWKNKCLKKVNSIQLFIQHIYDHIDLNDKAFQCKVLTLSDDNGIRKYKKCNHSSKTKQNIVAHINAKHFKKNNVVSGAAVNYHKNMLKSKENNYKSKTLILHNKNDSDYETDDDYDDSDDIEDDSEDMDDDIIDIQVKPSITEATYNKCHVVSAVCPMCSNNKEFVEFNEYSCHIREHCVDDDGHNRFICYDDECVKQSISLTSHIAHIHSHTPKTHVFKCNVLTLTDDNNGKWIKCDHRAGTPNNLCNHINKSHYEGKIVVNSAKANINTNMLKSVM